MTDDQFDEFHGERPKAGIKHFFDEGCICENLMVTENPYWERTKEIYYSKPPKLQKTARMTEVYYRQLKKNYPDVFLKSSSLKKKTVDDAGKSSERNSESPVSKDFPIFRKASTQARLQMATVKTQKRKHEGETTVPSKIKKTMSHRSDSNPKISHDTAVSADVDEECETSSSRDENQSKAPVANSFETLGLKGPLLQLPTGSAKLHTCLNLADMKVWKGPYREHKLGMVMFFHNTLKEILGDKHTLELECKDNYIIFPLIQANTGQIQIIKKTYYDCILKKQVVDGQFVERQALGLVQLHRVAPERIKDIPMSFWAHFAYRYALNIGDSGLYNAITDANLSFLYGIDMEENRRQVVGQGLMNLMFVKLPLKRICDEIQKSIKTNKQKLLEIVQEPTESYIKQMRDLGKKFNYPLDCDMFISRIAHFRGAVGRV